MSNRNSFAAVAAVLMAAIGTAQENGTPDLREEVRALRSRIEAVEAENARLKGGLERRDADDALETQVNRLIAKEGAVVRSVADPLTLIGEFRFRFAASLGENAPGTTPFGPGSEPFSPLGDEHDGWWGDALMRMGILYDFGKDVTAYSEMRAKWAFGQSGATSYPFSIGSGAGVFEGPPTGQYPGGTSPILDVNAFVFIHQAWLEVRNVFNAEQLSMRLGRQEIALGNQFQFGAAEWYDGFTFDAARFDWTAESFRLTALASKLQSVDGDLNQRTSFFNSHDDDDLLALYLTCTSVQDHSFDAYWIFVNGQGGAQNGGSGPSIGSLGNSVGDPAGLGGTLDMHTVGVRAGGKFPDVAAGFDYSLEAAYQFGDGRTGGGGTFDISAFTAEAELGFTLDAESSFRLFARGLFAEGPASDDLAYTPLYPSRHSATGFRARYGLFDLMPMTNVLSAQAGLHFDPAADWTLGATLLWAAADDSGVMPGSRRNGASFAASVPDEDFGVELDVWGEYRMTPQMVFGAGLALLFPSAAGEALWLLDGDTHLYAYLQARLAF